MGKIFVIWRGCASMRRDSVGGALDLIRRMRVQVLVWGAIAGFDLIKLV